MAVVYPARDGAKIWAKILKKLTYSALGSKGSIMNRLWWCGVTGTPAITAGSSAEIPVKLNDLIYQSYDDDVYIATVAPAAATAMTVVKIVD